MHANPISCDHDIDDRDESAGPLISSLRYCISFPCDRSCDRPRDIQTTSQPTKNRSHGFHQSHVSLTAATIVKNCLVDIGTSWEICVIDPILAHQHLICLHYKIKRTWVNYQDSDPYERRYIGLQKFSFFINLILYKLHFYSLYNIS